MFTPSSTWSFGSVLRLPLTTRNESRIDSGTGVFTGYPALDANFDAEGAAFYDPLTLELGTQIQTSESSKLLLEIDFQAWSKYETPYLKLSNPSGVIVSTGNVPVYQTRDILIPRVGHEIDLETWKLRAGYSYKPSIFSSLPTGAGNYLDPPSHRFAAGAGIKFDTFLGFASPYFLDFHLSYCHLASQTITKTAGNEGGVASDSKIGAPGYTAGGKIWGGGVSLSLEL
jgi:long-subunit fatty acid transport protein